MAEKKRNSGKSSGYPEKENDTYDPVFVAKILEGVRAQENGQKGLRIVVDNMWEEVSEPNPGKLPAHVLKSIEVSLKQIEDGKTISFKEFKRRHFSKK